LAVPLVGLGVGALVGLGVGFLVGPGVGFLVGLGVGFLVGLGVVPGVGLGVGAGVGIAAVTLPHLNTHKKHTHTIAGANVSQNVTKPQIHRFSTSPLTSQG
jgi:hypothetical protein